MFCFQYLQAAVTDSQVANWKDNKTAAFLLMFDDGLPSAYQVVIPELLKRNLIATFYVCPGPSAFSDPNAAYVVSNNEWKNLIPKTGMVYADHTLTHSNTYDLATEDYQIGSCQKIIYDLFYTDGKRHLMSYGQPGVDHWYAYGQELTDILLKYDLISRPTGDGHFAVYHWQTTDQMLALADKAIANKGMEYLITHGVERRVSEGDPAGQQDFWALNKDIFRAILDGLVVRRDKGDLWLTDHITEYKYQMERDNKPVFQVKKSNGTEIQLTMTGTLDRELYDLPVTVLTQVPATWVSAIVTQGAKSVSIPVNHGIAQYDAFPNGELITISKDTDPTAPQGSPSVVYLIQPGGSGATWNGVPGTIVDLTVQGKSFNEWYKSTTFTPADEIWLIKGTYTLTDTIATQTIENIRGGFAGTEQFLADRAKGTNAWDFTNETIIDGNNLTRGIVSNTGSTIDGLSIQNCNYAGAVLNTGTAAKITNSSVLQNCIVRNNTTTGTNSAGGVYLTTKGKLLNSYIHHNANTNTTQNGGGVFVSGVATVDGSTITYNTAGYAGGGIDIEGKAGGTVVNNCIVSNNEAKLQCGGGINLFKTIAFDAGTNLTVSNCTVTSNTAKTDGGGMQLDTNFGISNTSNCIVSNNTASGNGGGIFTNSGAYNVDGCTINGNVTKSGRSDGNGGGGIYANFANYSVLNVSNTVLTGNNSSFNSSKNSGAAIFAHVNLTLKNCLLTANTGKDFINQRPGMSITAQNCTFADNKFWDGTEGTLCLGWSQNKNCTFTNCLFYKCSSYPITSFDAGTIITYCGFDVPIPTTYVDKTGCITGLTAASFTDVTKGDWSLSTTSAAINAGTPITGLTTDLAGTVRPQGTAYDMGAYETMCYNTTVTFNTGGTVNSSASGAVVSQPNGSQLLFTIIPDNGKGIKSVLFNGVEVKDQLTNLIGSTYYNGGKFTSTQLPIASTLVVEFESNPTTGLEKIRQFVCFSDNQGIKLTGLSTGSKLAVYNVTGTMVLKETIKYSNLSIPLVPGFYVVTGIEAGKYFTQKVIVK